MRRRRGSSSLQARASYSRPDRSYRSPSPPPGACRLPVAGRLMELLDERALAAPLVLVLQAWQRQGGQRWPLPQSKVDELLAKRQLVGTLSCCPPDGVRSASSLLAARLGWRLACPAREGSEPPDPHQRPGSLLTLAREGVTADAGATGRRSDADGARRSGRRAQPSQGLPPDGADATEPARRRTWPQLRLPAGAMRPMCAWLHRCGARPSATQHPPSLSAGGGPRLAGPAAGAAAPGAGLGAGR